MISENDGWMVGGGGAILNWDGIAWRAVENPIHISLEQVVPVSADDVWAVSYKIISPPQTRSRLLHWDGKTWSEFINPTPIDGYIVSLSFADRNDGWAIVHKSGPETICYLYHWDGQAWTKFKQTSVLYDIEIIQKDSGWAVGIDNTILYWNGKSWEQQKSPLTLNFVIYSISAISVTNVWAAAGNNLLHWDGIEWERIPMEYDVLQVYMITDSDGWLILQNNDGVPDSFTQIIRHWNGNTWELPSDEIIPLRYPESKPVISTAPDGQVWAILDNLDIWHWDTDSWKPYYLKEEYSTTAIEFTSPHNAWIVGRDGYIAYWDGVKTQKVAGITQANLNDIAVIDARDVWVVGDDAEILHWDGEYWKRVESPSRIDDLKSVSFTSPEDGWIVGAYNNEGARPLLLHWDGVAWSYPDPNTIPPYSGDGGLTSANFLDASFGWATGGYDNTLWNWNGQTWTNVQNPADYWLYDVDILDREDAWAVGIQGIGAQNGIALHWNGDTWETELISETQFQSVEFRSSDDGWIGTSEEDVYHWNGIEWQKYIIPVYGVWDIAVSPDGKYWALTISGTILYLDE